MVRLGVLLLPIALVTAGCSGDRSGGPRGNPTAVVGNAPARTTESRTARVVIDGTDASATGAVDLTSGVSRLDVSDGSTVVLAGTAVYRRAKGAAAFTAVTTGDALPASLRPADPAAAVTLLGGMLTTRSDGGAEVRGASTLAYTVKIDGKAALSGTTVDAVRRDALARVADLDTSGEFQLQVAVDSQGRLRRILLPVPLRPGPPTTRVDGEPVGVTIDYFDFGGPAPIAVPTAATALQ